MSDKAEPTGDYTCAECDAPLAGDGVCPECGSPRKSVGVGVIVLEAAAALGNATVVSYANVLLKNAKDLIDQGQFSLAIVVCHTACEIATERAVAEAFRAKNIPVGLRKLLVGSTAVHNLGSPRMGDLYIALTGDDVRNELPFWQKFKASADRRHSIVHQGQLYEVDDATESLEVTTQMVNHLEAMHDKLMVENPAP